MNKQFLLISLIIAIVAGALAPIITAGTGQYTSSQVVGSEEITSRARLEMEEQILKSTVRVLIETWVVKADESGYETENTVGHATLMGGRYLVTHNHINVPLSIRPGEGDTEAYGKVYLFNAAGERVYGGPLSDFELVREDSETLVFAYKEDGLFEKFGFAPAEFADWSSQPLQAGMEVAQVDWDGTTTRVDWTTIKEVILEDGTPRLVLDDGAMPGASGGGIFRQGTHVANNWRLEERLEATGAVVSAVTTVALNSAQVVAS